MPNNVSISISIGLCQPHNEGWHYLNPGGANGTALSLASSSSSSSPSSRPSVDPVWGRIVVGSVGVGQLPPPIRLLLLLGMGCCCWVGLASNLLRNLLAVHGGLLLLPLLLLLL